LRSQYQVTFEAHKRMACLNWHSFRLLFSVNFILPLALEADMVTMLAYILVVAIVFLAVIIAIAIASLLSQHAESPGIDLRDIEEPFADGQNLERKAQS
jgi:hypothetical protein